MQNSISSVVNRYNEIRMFLNLPKDNLYTEIKNQMKPFEINYVSKKRREEIVWIKYAIRCYIPTLNIIIIFIVKERRAKFKETELILYDLRSPTELLNNRIVDHGITPTYRFLTRNTSGQQFIYNYSCSLFGMYGEWIM